MILDDVYPEFPGDVRNASGFSYHIQYEIGEGVDIKQLLWHEDKSPCLEPILKAAKKSIVDPNVKTVFYSNHLPLAMHEVGDS